MEVFLWSGFQTVAGEAASATAQTQAGISRAYPGEAIRPLDCRPLLPILACSAPFAPDFAGPSPKHRGSLNIDSFSTSRQIGLLMLNAIVIAIRIIVLIFNDHKQVAVENAALRQQLAVFRRDVKRPKLRGRDRLFWVALRMI